MVGASGTLSSVLVDTAARLGDFDERLTFLVGASGPGWHAVSQIEAGGVTRWVDRIARDQAGDRHTAAAFLARYLITPVVEAPVAAYLLMRRVPQIDPRAVALHRHPGGWFDRLAIDRCPVAVLPGDEAASAADAAVVEDLDGLRSQLAHRLYNILEPLLITLQAGAPFGLHALWGTGADLIATVPVVLATRMGMPPPIAQAAWNDCDGVVDELAVHCGILRARPRLEVEGHAAPVFVRGTCCLYYRCPAAVDGPDSTRYCTSCPLLPH